MIDFLINHNNIDCLLYITKCLLNYRINSLR